MTVFEEMLSGTGFIVKKEKKDDIIKEVTKDVSSNKGKPSSSSTCLIKNFLSTGRQR